VRPWQAFTRGTVPAVADPAEHDLGSVRILVDQPHEILVTKLCALLSRSELRDLEDVRALLDAGGDLARALADAPRKEAGFSPVTLAWVLEQLPITAMGRALGRAADEISGLEAFRQELARRILAAAKPGWRFGRHPNLRQWPRLPDTSIRLQASGMNPENRRKLETRVTRAAEAALATQGYVSAIDVLLGIGWLAPAHLKEWRTGRLAYLEGSVQANLSRISEAMRLFRAWASGRRLLPSETMYLARTPDRRELRFCKSGDPTIERAYRTHWVSPDLSEKKRQRLRQKANRPTELVVIDPLSDDWKCHRCGGSGGFLIMEPPGPACLGCAGLERLEFLASGDAALTRLAKAGSREHAVVVRFSRTRRRIRAARASRRTGSAARRGARAGQAAGGRTAGRALTPGDAPLAPS
jgi:hypothetical protein